MRFSLLSLLLLVTLAAVPFAWLYDHRNLSERNQKLADEIRILNKEKTKIQAFANAARAETESVTQKLKDYGAAFNVLMLQLKRSEEKRHFSTAGLSDALEILLNDLHNAEATTAAAADGKAVNDLSTSSSQFELAASRFLSAVRSTSQKSP
jgi:hypothetical protein